MNNLPTPIVAPLSPALSTGLPEDAPARPPAQGEGHLTFTRNHDGHTAITRSSATSPLRILSPKPVGPSAWAFTSNFGGGLVSGDHLALRITAHPHTTAYLSTQSSTKIYRSTHDQLTRQSLHADLHEDSLLLLTPDPVVCFAHARYRQSQSFHLAPTASLLLLDGFTSGRYACGERWQLHSLQFRNELFLQQRRLLLDNLRLDMADGPLDSAFRTGHFNCFATLLLIGPRLAPFAQPLLRQLQAAPIPRAPDLCFGISPFADGLILRLAATRTELATQFLLSHLAFLQDLLGEHPWHRKW